MKRGRGIGSFTALALALAPAPAGAQDAVETLVQRLSAGDSREWSEAMDRLVALGARAVPKLESVVRNRGENPGDACVRAVRTLHRIGGEASGTIPVLLDALEDGTDRHFRKALVLALGELAPHAPDRRPEIRAAVLDLLVDQDTGRFAGIWMLELLDFQDVCSTHARTILGPESSDAEVLAALGSENPFLREYAAMVLGTRPTPGEGVIEALEKTMRGEHPREIRPESIGLSGTGNIGIYLDKRIHVAAATAMVRLAPGDPRSIPAFTLLLERPETAARLAAVTALRHAGGNAAPLLPQLLRMARREEPSIRYEAISALGMMGGAGVEAVPLLERLAEDPDRQIAERARAALRQIRRR